MSAGAYLTPLGVPVPLDQPMKYEKIESTTSIKALKGFLGIVGDDRQHFEVITLRGAVHADRPLTAIQVTARKNKRINLVTLKLQSL